MIPLIETRDRTSLFYKDWGNGKPVVFIHGWALGADMWEYQTPQLKVYEGAAHGLFITEKDRLNADLLAFIPGRA